MKYQATWCAYQVYIFFAFSLLLFFTYKYLKIWLDKLLGKGIKLGLYQVIINPALSSINFAYQTTW